MSTANGKTTYNPYAGQVVAYLPSDFYDLQSPIPPSIADPREMVETFKRYGIIPAFGTTEASGHTFLNLLDEATRLSASFTSCVGNLNSYAFGLAFDVAAAGFPGLVQDAGVPQPSIGEKIAFAEQLAGLGLKLSEMLSLSQMIHQHLRASGNAYLIVQRVRVGGAARFRLFLPHFTQVAYLRTIERPDSDFLIYTRDWSDQYMQKYPPLIAPASYISDDEIRWSEPNEQGAEYAIIHLRWNMGSDNQSYYGRPKILAVLDWLAADIFGATAIAKTASTLEIAKNIFMFEQADPNNLPPDQEGDDDGSGDDEFVQRMMVLRNVVTNLGERTGASSVGGIEYPHGTREPTVAEVKIARDFRFMSFNQDYSANTIYSVMNWSTSLSGFRVPASGLGSNVLRDLLITKQVSTIEPIQTEFSGFWNWLISGLSSSVGVQLPDLSLVYQDVISSLVESLGGGDAPGPEAPTDPTAANQNSDAA